MEKVKMNRADVQEMFIEHERNGRLKSLLILVVALVVVTTALILIPKTGEES